MRIAVTGHRPNKIGHEYEGNGPYSSAIRYVMQAIINTYKPAQLITGMALGVDMLWAEAAILNNIPFIAAIPCLNQEVVWPAHSQTRYNKLIQHKLCTVHHVSIQPYTKECMQLRNVWMVDNSDMLLAIWDGTGGGTANCVNYATNTIKHTRPDYSLRIVNPKTLVDEHSRLNQGYPV